MMTFAGAAASYAQVSVEAGPEHAGTHHISLSGRIDVHALYSFVRLMSDPRISEDRQPSVTLDSIGGSVTAAMAIGHLIRDRGFTTIVERGKECLSACVLILAAGKERTVLSGKVGVHRPRHGVAVAAASTAAQTRANDQLINDMQRYLRAMGMGERFFAAMVAVPPDRMKMLSRAEMHAFGLLPGHPPAVGPQRAPAATVVARVSDRVASDGKSKAARLARSRPRMQAAAAHVRPARPGVRKLRRVTNAVRLPRTSPKASRSEARINVNAFGGLGRGIAGI